MTYVLLASPIYQYITSIFPKYIIKLKLFNQNIHQSYFVKSSEAFIRLTSFIFPKKEARCNIFVLQLSICQMQEQFYSVNGALSVFYILCLNCRYTALSYVKLSFLSIWVSCKSVVIQLSIYHYLALTLCLSP